MALEKRVKNYWEGEARRYSSSIKNELDGKKRGVWKKLILDNALLPSKGEKLKVLDIGTGPGFFPIILGEEGHDVTGIDLTENMLQCARENAEREGVPARFIQMNCQELTFGDETFDLLICRNLTWILENPIETYDKWKKVLKTGGCLLIFDANWNYYLFDEKLEEKHKALEGEVRQKFGETTHEHCDMDESEAISRLLPMGRYDRPVWDLNILVNLGFSRVFAEPDIGRLVHDERELFAYKNTPMFMVGGIKS